MSVSDLKTEEFDLDGTTFVVTQFAAMRGFEIFEKMTKDGGATGGTYIPSPPMMLELLSGAVAIIQVNGKSKRVPLDSRGAIDAVFSGPGSVRRMSAVASKVAEVNWGDFQAAPDGGQTVPATETA